MGVYVHFLLDPDDPAPEKKGRGVTALGASRRRRETSCALGPDHTGGGEGSRDALTLTPRPPTPAPPSARLAPGGDPARGDGGEGGRGAAAFLLVSGEYCQKGQSF